MSRHSRDPALALLEARAAGYTAARVAQGVPVLDRDLNLLGELAAQSVREVLCRYLGDGLVSDQGAFEVRVTKDRKGVELGGPGWAVVAGMEVSIDATRPLDTFIAVNSDSELPVETDTTEIWYWLEVWLVEVDDTKDPALANPDDVGVLTSTRWRPTWTTRRTNSSAAPSLEAGHRALALARVCRTGTTTLVEDLRPVGLTLGQKGAAMGRLTLLKGAASATWSPSGVETGAGGFAVTSASGSGRVVMDPEAGERLLITEGAERKRRLLFDEKSGLHLGGSGETGSLHLYGDLGVEFFRIDGGDIFRRILYGFDQEHPVFRLNTAGLLELDGYLGSPAILTLKDRNHDPALELNGGERSLKVKGTSSTYSEVTSEAVVSSSPRGRTRLSGDRLEICDAAGKVSVVLSDDTESSNLYGTLTLGGAGKFGRILMCDASTNHCLDFLSAGSGNSFTGHITATTQTGLDEPKLTATLSGKGLTLKSGDPSTTMLKLDTETGVGTFAGTVKFPQSADCAERFPLADEQVAPPGTVLVTSTDEALRPCDQPYDTRVVGVVSGAGGLKPGIVLNDALADGAVVALVGRVYCKVDASFGAIAVGDLLTTSSTPGHAMKAVDRERAFGAVLGKALGALPEGQGLIPILVTLQ